MRRRNLSGLFLLVALVLWSVGQAQTAEFSALIVTTSKGEVRQSKIYVKGDKIRREFTNPSGATIMIVPGDKKIMWLLEPQKRTYMEMPFEKDAFIDHLHKPQDEGGGKLVGTETLKGYATDKYEAPVKTPAGMRPGTIWYAQKLEAPIRIETADKLFSQEYKNIKEGGVADALFEKPSGYQQKPMPAPRPQSTGQKVNN